MTPLIMHTNTARSSVPLPQRCGWMLLGALLLALMPLCVQCETMYFQPTNVAQPSLYQTAELRFVGWSSLDGDPTVQAGDFMYIISTSATTCSNTAPSSSNSFAVTANVAQNAATAVVIVSPTVFSVGTSYSACYVSTSTNLGYVVQRMALSSGTLVQVPFTVLAAVYQTMAMSPTVVYAGQGLITVTVAESDQSANGRPLNQGGLGGVRPYFLACGASCGTFDTLASLCASSSGVVFSSIDGYATTTLSGTFTAPLSPSSTGYALCVPYCYSSTAGCSADTYTVPWTVVTSSTTIFQPANPTSYFFDPLSPTVRMTASANITGTGLLASDRVKVITNGSSCSSSSAALLSNVNYNQAVTLVSSTSTAVPFTSLTLTTTPIVGQLCYALGANPTIFAPLFQSGSSADFVVSPMQVTSITTTPAAPTLGQSFAITFTGTSLSAATDLAYLVTSSSSTCTVTSSSDLCDGTTTNANYSCTLTGSTSPVCTVTVDPDTNSAATLCACYRVPRSKNYGMVNGSVTLSARNPVYTIAPYPLYEGQQATITFSGSGIASTDTVRFVASGDVCTGTPITNVTAYNGASSSSTASVFSIAGPGSLCMRVCYQFTGSSVWIITRPTTSISVVATCASTLLYISPFDLRYTLGPTSIVARGTSTATFTTAATPSAFMVVPATSSTCVITNCGTGPACAQTALAADYFSAVSSTVGTFGITRTGSQVLCVSLGSTYIPVLQSTGAGYLFTSGAQNPATVANTPALWRVSMSNLTATFTGTGLNASNDILRVVNNNTLLSTKGVCPQEAASVTVLLTATADASADTTTTTFSLRGADTLTAGTTVYFCYYRGVSGSRVAGYVGSIAVQPQNPATMTSSGSLRAGELVSLLFTAATSSTVTPASDTLTFFQYQQSSITPTCRCDSVTCAGAISSTTTSIVMTGSTTASTWRNPLGFNNYAAAAIYVACYTVAAAGSSTYTGQLSIAQSHPSYYTLGSTSVRVGLPIVITVTTLCTTCSALSASDSIIIVQNTSHCADVTAMNATQAEAVTAVTYSSPNTQRSVVPLLTGFYRVCYKKSNDTVFSELAFSSSFASTPITVAQADPAAFSPIPVSPSAGQYMIINLTACSATVCSTCSALRVIRGTSASCWNTSLTAYASTSCVGTSTVYQFPNQYFTAGSYTVCFGDTAISRVPGTLVIAAANPAYYTAASTSIFTNQGSKANIGLFGTGLTVADRTFLLPNFTYSCHDLRDSTLDIIADATFAGWWSPSVNAYSITLNSTSVAQWVASDSSNRFTQDIISSSKFCSNVGVSCGLQLCYLRNGASWAPVNMQTNTRMTLFPANPQTVVFDVSSTPRVTQYVLATVTGTGLTTSDTLYFADGLCDTGTLVARTVSTATTNGTTWVAVVRFVGRNSGTVTACYTSGVTTTQILTAPSIFSIAAPLYYMKQPTWNETQTSGSAAHNMTQYESVYIAGTTSATGASAIVNVVLMYLVNQADECNYPSYPVMSFPVQMAFDRVDNQTSYFLGRLYKSGSFALCVNTSGLLFRIVGSATNNAATAITVATPNPSSYTVVPTTPFVNQPFTVSFIFATGTSFEIQNVTGDAAALINSTLQGCGFSNVTTLALPINSSGTGALTIPTSNTSVNLTLCYRTYNGSSATIPRFGLADRNFRLAAPYPRYFSTLPLAPQRTVSLNITFYSNGTGPLTTADRAYLVLITNTTTGPQASDCSQSQSALTATAITVSGTTSTWSITAALNTLAAGSYSICYIVATNGRGAIVDLSGYLVLSERQSPYGITTDSVGGLAIYSGERAHVYFLSNVTLSPALSWMANASQDAVYFSAVTTCATSLTNAQVDAIPGAFFYNDTTTRTEAFVHVRFRTTGTFYVCMKRVGRTPSQQYYNYDVVGGPDSPVAIVVSAAPMLSTTFSPATPRAAVPKTLVIPSYTSGFTATSFATIFAVPYANATSSDSLKDDACYYPPLALALGNLTLNTTLMFFTSNLTAAYPFPTAGRYRLCYNLPQRNVASLPVPFVVGNMSPINYAVPDLIAPGTTFSMVFTAIDAIFASTGNVATVVSYSGTAGATPSCDSITAATGTSNFTAFTGNQTVSSTQPLLTQQGTYYVCFRTYDQTQYFPVPNIAGGYTFGVGNVGPTSYTVSPTPRYAGQLISLSIVGNALRAADTAKVVNVTGLAASNATYFALCSSTSPVATDSNALASNSTLGTNVTLTSTNFVTLDTRIMASGVFILCYRGATNAWAYVPDVMSFTVNGPVPNLYVTSPLVPYVTQTVTLSLRSAAGGLTTSDDFKLVLRGTSANGFDCDTATVNSITYTFVSSSATERNVTFCNQTAASFTVCYRLAGGTWAEVPSRTGAYAAMVIAAVPLTLSTVTISTTPRPVEQYRLLFATTATGTALTTVSSVQYVNASLYAACGGNTMVAPLFSTISGLAVRASMSASGQYRVLVALNSGDPLITLAAPLTIVPCDPCTFTPLVMFSAGTYNLTFFSPTSSFSSTDAVRIIPSSLSLGAADVCTSTTGSFGALTLAPSSTTLSQVTVLVTTPSTSAGSYYVCYRKNTTTDYAVVGSSLGVPAVLQVINAEPQSFTLCPSVLFGGEGASFNFTTTQPTVAPLSASDRVFLVDSSSTCTSTTASTYPLTFGLNGTGYGVFDVVLPGVSTATTLRVCYQHRLDTVARSVGTVTVSAQDPAAFTTQPTNISVGLSNGNVSLTGTALTASDAIYFVSNTTSCEEYCRTSPITLANVGPSFTLDTSALPTTIVARLNGSFTTTGTVSICYRRAGGTLAKLPQSLVIAPANPVSYTTNFVPRFRTRPQFNFTGTSLGLSDIVKVVAEGLPCATTSGIATGEYSSSSTAGSWSAFLIPLNEPMYVGSFTVCYNLGGSGGWVPVAPTLQVLPGGPLAYSTTNTPMAGRAIATSFAAQDFSTYFGVGDQVRIVCGACNCWTSAATTVAYGAAEQTITSTASPSVLRFGVGTAEDVLVCYRVADSGFGLVASMTIASAFPTNVARFPDTTLRGQRISLTVSGNYSGYSISDQVMIASSSRGCWDSVVTNPSAVFSIGNLSTVSTTEGTGVVQVPSLGPTAESFTFSFPLDVTVCFRQAGQPELVFVPFPSLANFTVLPSNPAALSPTPTVVREGMINVSITFSTAAVVVGDNAYAVTGDWGDRICDASTTVAVGSTLTQAAVGFSFTALRVDGGVLQGRNITACVIKANGTVAEVPQQIVVAPRNPASYTLNTTTPRNREYVQLVLHGTALTTSMSLVLASSPCLYGALDTTVHVSGRVSDAFGNTTSIGFVVQVLGPTETFTAYVCVLYGGAWSELGSFAVARAVPSALTATPASPRGGQHVILALSFPSVFDLTNAAVLWTTGPQSWCTNFTSTAEPSLLLDTTNQRVSSNVWLPYGTIRLCIYSNTFQLWRDVDDALYNLSSITILPPNPSSQWTYPLVPRVGQRVTLYFSLIVAAQSGDRVVLLNASAAGMSAVACDDTTVTSQQQLALTTWNSTIASVVISDATDPLQYRSFSTVQSVRVCYYSSLEGAWSAAGGTVSSSTFAVAALSPFQWQTTSGSLVVQKPSIIGFTAVAGTVGALDSAFLVPLGSSCANRTCSSCMEIALDASTINSTYIASLPFSPQLDGNFSVCYVLTDATAAMVPGVMSIATGDIQCVEQAQVQVGLRQNLTFRVLPNVNTTADTFQISVWGSSTGLCNASILPDFPEARATRVASTTTSVTYSLEWPVTLNSSRYTICYKHLGESGRVCACSQFDARVSDCYVTTTAAVPGPFTTAPKPTYVGQLIALMLVHPSTVTLSNVVLVPYATTNLSTCRNAASPVFLSSAFTQRLSTSTTFQFKHDYRTGSGQFLVCSLLAGATEYSRVPTYDNDLSTLFIRPYLQMTTLPTLAAYFRAHSTLQLTTTHASLLADDVVNVADAITFVQDPLTCNESFVDGNTTHAAEVMAAIQSADSTIKANGVGVVEAITSNTSSVTYVTFAGIGSWYLCYRLAGATWSVVNRQLAILPAAWDGCTTTATASSANSDTGALRAFQYFPVALQGSTAVFLTVQTSSDDMYLVRSTDACFNQTAAIFAPSRPFIFPSGYPTAVGWSPYSGSVKLCYRIGGSTNTSVFSPVCNISLNAGTPSGTTSSCLLAGETMSVTAATATPIVFSTSDVVWFTSNDHCYYSNTSVASPSSQFILNYSATQTTFVPTSTSGSAVFAPLTFAGTARSLRMCYRNAVGSYFSIPLNSNTDGTIVISARQPRVTQLPSYRLHVAQLPPVLFLARNGTPELQGGNVTVPPMAAATTTIDASGVAPTIAVSEGACSRWSPSLYQVAQYNLTATLGALVLTASGTHVACYRLAQCTITDVPSSFRVYEANPASMALQPTPARKGQLLNITFQRVQNESDALFLTPGADRGVAIDTSVQACWQLSATSGQLVSGTPLTTWVQTIIYADPPAQAAAVVSVGCYLLVQSPSWSTVPNSQNTIYPANPSYFTTATTPMAYQQIQITFVGANFSSGDRAKIIPLSLNCSDAFVPPATLTAFTPDVTQSTLTGTGSGWFVNNLNAQTSVLNITSNVSATYSVCYRLANDTVWTLVYSNLVVQPRNPELAVVTPTSALESEIFTVAFARSNFTFDAAQEMSTTDRLELVNGADANCMITRSADIISTAPSRTDLLPNYTFFQMASATRGLFTLCYVRWVGGVRIPTWGYPTVTILPNPTSFFTHVSSPAINQYIGIVFLGFGLQSISGRVDSVKLLASTEAQTDLACRTASQTSSVLVGDFRAFGNYSIQTVVALAPQTVWVCYKLYGGQYHVMASSLTFASASMTLSPALKTSATDGEQLSLGIQFLTTGWRQGDYAFLSTQNCSDILVSLSTATDTLSTFSVSSNLTQDNVGLMHGALRPTAPGTYSVCYRSPNTPTGGVTTILQWSLIISQGIPAALPSTLPFVAQRFLTIAIPWNASDVPTGSYLTLVRSTTDCVGQTQPTSAVYAESTSWNATHVSITAVLPSSGAYFLCSSRPVAPCGVGTLECARVVGTLSSFAAVPLGWASVPVANSYAPLERVRFQFYTSDVPSSATSVFLRSMSSTTPLTSATILPCVNTSASTVALTATTLSSTNVYQGYLPGPGSFVVCVGIDNTVAVFPSQFITAVASSLTSITPTPTSPYVTDVIVLEALGSGLSSNDTMRLVQLPLQETYTASALVAACSNASLAFVAGSPETVTSAASSVFFAATASTSAKYSTCYQFSYATTWVTGSVVVVSPRVTSVSVSSQPLYALSPFSMNFVGLSLSAGDQVGFALASRGCFLDSIAYFAVTNVNYTSSTATGLTISSAATYVACFKAAVGTVQQLSPLLVVVVRQVVAAQFVVQPVCSEFVVCSQQPSVVMLDGGGSMLGEIGATISLTLQSTDGTNRNDALAGNSTYSYLSTGRFDYYTVMIVSAGSYRMTATILLLGGATLVATSSVIVVPTNTSLRTLSLACTPALLLRGSTPGVISCTIAATTNSTASVFAISPSSGNTSSVQQSYAGGLPLYSFTVDVSMTNYSLHFVIIAVASADSRYPGRIVDNSPAIVRIASVPDNSSLLVCTSNVTFNSIRYVRAVGAVSCALQGRVVVGSLTYDIIAPSSYFSVTASVDGVGTAVSLPSLPQGLNVAYTFTASPATAGSLFTIAANIAATAQSVVGSPSTFVILRTPSTSTLACHTTGIAIYDYFLPGEGITCTIILQDTNGVTQTPTYDLQPIIDSGSVQSISGSTLITNATFTATAPVGLGAVVLSTRYFAALATPQDQTFTVRVVYIPNNQTIASSSGTIVLATRVLGGENLVAGQQATLLISGSGLVLTHTYTVSPFASCNNTGSVVPGVTARGSTVAGDLALTFTTPSYPFYVCFQRSTLDSAHPLVQGVFHNITVAAAGGGLTNDDIILIVVACVLFCILLLLLPCVLWKLRSKPGPDPVFMYAPRVNDQYIHRPVTSSVVVSQTPAASTPRGSINNVPPPPGGMRDDFSFAPTIVPQDETESIKEEKKKKKKKIDASVKKIATMQQNELDARRSVQSSEHGGESPTMPPPNAGAPLQSTSNFLQPAHVITVEERHTHTYTSGPTGLPVVRPVTYEESVFVPPYDSGVQQEHGVHPQTATARPFSVFGHTSQQFAAEN